MKFSVVALTAVAGGLGRGGGRGARGGDTMPKTSSSSSLLAVGVVEAAAAAAAATATTTTNTLLAATQQQHQQQQQQSKRNNGRRWREKSSSSSFVKQHQSRLRKKNNNRSSNESSSSATSKSHLLLKNPIENNYKPCDPNLSASAAAADAAAAAANSNTNSSSSRDHGDDEQNIVGILGTACQLNEYCLDLSSLKEETAKAAAAAAAAAAGSSPGGGICIPREEETHHHPEEEAGSSSRSLQQDSSSSSLALNDPFERMFRICGDVNAQTDENAYYYEGYDDADADPSTEGGGGGGESFGEGGNSNFQPESDLWSCECPESFPPDNTEFRGSLKCSMSTPKCSAIPDVCNFRSPENGYGAEEGDVVGEQCLSQSIDASFTGSWTGTYEHCWTMTQPFDLEYCLTYKFDGTPNDKASSCEVSFNGQQCTSCSFIELFDSVQGLQYDCLEIDCTNLVGEIDPTLNSKMTVCTGAYYLDLTGVTQSIGQSILTTNLLYEHLDECEGCNVCYGGDNNGMEMLFYMTKPSEIITLEEFDMELSCHELQLKALSGQLKDQFPSCILLSELAAQKCGCTCGTKGQACSDEFVNDAPPDGDNDVPGDVDVPDANTFSLGDCTPVGVNLECRFTTTFQVDDETPTYTLANAKMSCPADDMGFLEVAKQPDTCQCSIGNIDTACDCYVCPSSNRVALSCPTNIIPSDASGKKCSSIGCSGNCISDVEEQFECVPFSMTEAPAEDSTFFLSGPLAEESKGKDDTLYVGLSEERVVESVGLLTFELPSQEIDGAVYCENKSATLTLNHVPITDEDARGTEMLTYVPMRVFGVQGILGVDGVESFNGTQFPLFELQTTQAIRGDEFIVTPTQEIVEIDVSNLLMESNAGSTRRGLAEDAEKDSFYILLLPVDTGTYGVGDSFYARENTEKGPSLSIAYSGGVTGGGNVDDSGDGTPVVQPGAPGGANLTTPFEPILPDPEECTVYSDGNVMCPLVTKFSTGEGSSEAVMEARLLCPAEKLQMFEGDFSAATRNEDACSCAASLITSPITDSDSDVEEDPDVVIGDGDDGADSENPTRRQLHAALLRRMQETQDLECECHICPDNGDPSSIEHKYAYTCTSPIVGECKSYDCNGSCNTPFVPTRIEQEDPSSQNEEFTPNDCDKLTIGNFYFTFVNSIDPDEVVIFGFEDIPAGLELFLTDNAWNGIGFENNEGILQLTTPQSGIPAGTPFGYGPNSGVDGSGAYDYGDDWTEVASPFSLSQDGEQVFLFCLSGNDDARPIAAISYNGEFSEPGLSSYDLTQSALPASLADEGTIVLPHEERWEYQSKDAVLDIEVLKADIRNTDNWKGTSQSGAAGGFYGKANLWTGLVAVVVSCYFLI